MANVLLAIATLVVGFVLATYGVFANVEASQRTQIANTVRASLMRQAEFFQDRQSDLGRVLDPSPSGSDHAEFLPVLEAERTTGQAYSYAVVGTDAFLCVTSVTSTQAREAFERVARDWPGATVSGACGNPSSPAAASVVLSVKVN